MKYLEYIKTLRKKIIDRFRNTSSYLKITFEFEIILILSIIVIMTVTTNRVSTILREAGVGLADDHLEGLINTIKLHMIITAAVAILLTSLIGSFLYKVHHKRVYKLIESMKEVEQGNFKTRLEIKNHDEIGQISESFNEMCEKLNEYVDKVYIAQVQRKNSEMNALQTQINPHFLYNTLESIKAKAVINNDEETAAMISILGNMFRWISRTGEKVIPLDEELEYIKNYMQLQSYRFDMELEICRDVPEELLDCLVPKLILQPIVENVVKHALDVQSDKDKIFGIHVADTEDTIGITIYDNGKGIRAAELNEINRKLSEEVDQDKFESIGLQNVNQRIKLLYGKEYGVKIKSLVGFGTAVKIILPKEM